MIGLALCVLAFAICVLAARRGIVPGLIAVLCVGYVYGILRANVPQPLSHFVFDAAVAGLYLAQLQRRPSAEDRARTAAIRPWMLLLVGWPLLLFLLPVQDPFIQLVGLRAHIFLLFFLFYGARLRSDDMRQLGSAVAVLNVLVFGVALAEYIVGIEPFFPRNAVTELIYRSKDIEGYTAYRIPSTFTSAHAYSGTMTMSTPFLVALWTNPQATRRGRALAVVAIALSAIGIFMSGARLHMVVYAMLLLAMLTSARLRVGYRITAVVAMLLVGFVVARNDRLQRFRTLEDTEYVQSRVEGSVNENFFALAERYPMGNGLGGGGTSIPYFLQERLRDPIGMENEYAHIMLEQGIPGLLMWIVFILWIVAGYGARQDRSMRVLRRVGLVCVAAYFASGIIGTGTLTSIPQTMLLLLLCGWGAAKASPAPVAVPRARETTRGELRYG